MRSRTTSDVRRPSPVVARWGQENVAGLLAAEGRVVDQHLFEDVAVADGGAEHTNAAALEGGFEAHVGHGGGDNQVSSEQATGFEIAGGDEEDGIAVDDVAMCAGQHATVSIAVEGEA